MDGGSSFGPRTGPYTSLYAGAAEKVEDGLSPVASTMWRIACETAFLQGYLSQDGLDNLMQVCDREEIR